MAAPVRKREPEEWITHFQLNDIGTRPAWRGYTPFWHQKIDPTRAYLAKILLFAGLVIAICSVVTIYDPWLTEDLREIYAIVYGALAVPFLAFGLYLQLKSYWNDPDYWQEKRLEVLKSLVNTFGDTSSQRLTETVAQYGPWAAQLPHRLFNREEINAIYPNATPAQVTGIAQLWQG